MALAPVLESPMEGRDSPGSSLGRSEVLEIDGSPATVSGFRDPHTVEGGRMHRHRSTGEAAVREFIEINQKEASKIEHEHEAGCGMIDFYEYEPRVIRRVYRSWTGCIVSHFSLIAFLLLVCYACWQYWVVPFHVIMGETAVSSEDQISVISEPALPKVGLDFRLANGSSFSDPSFLTYSFAQRTIYYQDKLPRKTVRLNYSRCAFAAEDDGPDVATAMCPDETHVVLQGIFSSPVYSYLQLDITPCINSTSSPVVCQSPAAIAGLLAGGTSVIMGNAANFALRGITVPDRLTAVTTYTSFRYDLTLTFYQKVDVLLTPRDVTKKSSVVDIDQWREHATDIVVSGVVPTLSDRAPTSPLIRYYVRLDTVSQEIELEPYKNFMDLAEMLGSFKALLDLILGIPLRYLNRWFFLREVEKEVRRGALHSDMLLPNSSRPKPNRLQSIMRHIHTVKQNDSFERRAAQTPTDMLRSSFKKAKERVWDLFALRPPESPTRVPLRSARDRYDPGKVPRSPTRVPLRSARAGGIDEDACQESSVWIDIPADAAAGGGIGRRNGNGLNGYQERRALEMKERSDPHRSTFGDSGSGPIAGGTSEDARFMHANTAWDSMESSGGEVQDASSSLERVRRSNPLFGEGNTGAYSDRRSSCREVQPEEALRATVAQHRSSDPGAFSKGMVAGRSNEEARGTSWGLSGIGQGANAASLLKRSSFSG